MWMSLQSFGMSPHSLVTRMTGTCFSLPSFSAGLTAAASSAYFSPGDMQTGHFSGAAPNST